MTLEGLSARPFVAGPPGSPVEATVAAARAAEHWGFAAPQLLRMGSNAIFSAGDEVVLRVCRPTAPAEQAIWLATELERCGIRVPRAVRDAPFVVGAMAVLAVEHIVGGAAVDWIEVGEMVARVHAIEPSEVLGRYPLPWCASFPWWDFDALLARVGASIDDAALAALRASVDRHLPVIGTARDGQLVVCHGDVHPGNVLASDDGMVLIDWDLLCCGPVGWDHGPLMTWTERWGGAPGIYESFAEGYGRSLRGDPLAEAIAELRLVAATFMRVLADRGDPGAAGEAAGGPGTVDAIGADQTEAQRRLRWWRGDPDAPTWRAQ